MEELHINLLLASMQGAAFHPFLARRSISILFFTRVSAFLWAIRRCSNRVAPSVIISKGQYTPSTRHYGRSPNLPFRTPLAPSGEGIHISPSGPSPGTTWWKVDINTLLVATPSVVYRAASGRLLLALEGAQEEQDMLPVCLGPQAGPDSHLLPPCGAQGRHAPVLLIAQSFQLSFLN